MLSHEQIWRGIDRLAESASLSPSALARRAGLDATTFNRSKRVSADGSKPRWPSTESLAKALAAVGVDFEAFAAMAAGHTPAPHLPALDLAETGASEAFDATGLPAGEGWTRLPLIGLDDTDAYVVTIHDESMSPVFRVGDQVMVSPKARPRPGDRVVARTRDGEVLPRQLGRLTANTLELICINRRYPDRTLTLKETEWVAKIVWASQ
jgi:phage repressor protein C with HTH and peptisase S24 domain